MVASRARTAAPASASAPRRATRICGCPMCSRAMSRQTGDASVLDEIRPYLEGPAVPEHEDTWIVIPRAVARDRRRLRTLRAARSTTRCGISARTACRCSAPATGTTASTRWAGRGVGTSVWMGFFLSQRARRRSSRSRARRATKLSHRAAKRRAQALREALEVGWRGDHYALDFADDGQVVDMPNAMTTGWAAYSGAVDFERALAAIEGGLKSIERPEPRACCWKRRSSSIHSPIPAASPIIPPACARTAANTAMARPGSSTASCGSPKQARARGDETAAARADRARIRDLREDLAAEEDRSRANRALRPHPHPATRRHL